MAEDYERMTEKYRNIRFEVVAKGFEVLNRYEVWVDEGLLFHALANVLDNAGKYSYADSVVQVSAGITGTGRFHLSVTNKGLRIRTEHLPRLTERGFRSDEAMSASGEGSGIGLFIVQRIMDAHNGELLIIPANQEGRTEVKLLFPAGKIGPH
jgi:signal transduction histidine kinase